VHVRGFTISGILDLFQAFSLGHPARCRPVKMREEIRVENSAGITASLQGRYASALFDLASEHDSVVSVESDLDQLAAALDATPDFADLIRNPLVGRTAAGKAVDGVAELLNLSPLTRKFLGVLAVNGRLATLPRIISAYAAIAAASRGEVTAQVTSAHPLTDTQIAQLAEKLKAREGKAVKIRTTVDPDILGGLVVTIGSQQIDSSIRTRLNSLAQVMKG
jgi:F-type H+-transporting ATPase subunit delta